MASGMVHSISERRNAADFLMTPDFIRHCFATIDQVLEGVGNYLSEQNDAKENGTPRILEA